MSDAEIEDHRIAGELHLVLENGSVEEKASLLRIFEEYRTPEDYQAIRDSHNLNDDGTTKS